MRGLLGLLLLSVLLAGGCNTAAGNYFSNRARDLGECFRLEVEAGWDVGFGADVRAAGIADVGLYARLREPWCGAGVVYGAPHAFAYNLGLSITSDSVLPLIAERHPPGRWSVASFGIPAALFSYQSGDTWLWSARGRAWSRVHAFDIEVKAGIGVLAAGVGFSLGEFLDFVLGWFGIDIAGDDVPLPRSPDD